MRAKIQLDICCTIFIYRVMCFSKKNIEALLTLTKIHEEQKELKKLGHYFHAYYKSPTFKLPNTRYTRTIVYKIQ